MWVTQKYSIFLYVLLLNYVTSILTKQPKQIQSNPKMNKNPKLEEQTLESLSSIHNQMISISSSNSNSNSSDLPNSILIEILGRLPFKTLINCRYVCKSWKSLLSESYFYRKYYFHMPTKLIIQIKGSSLTILRQIYMIESCIDNFSSLMRKFRFFQRGRAKIDPNFRFQLGNSCNGLICVREISTREPTLVCNPLMGQFVMLPKPDTGCDDDHKAVSGFGFCGRTNRYKVVRIFHKNLDPSSRLRVEIYEVGVGDKWREIGYAPYPIPSKIPGFYTNNSLHWIMDNDSNSELICCFDFIDEKFKLVSPPPIYSKSRKKMYHWSNLGVITGCLSICAIDSKIFRADVQIWVMDEYGVPESWRMMLSIRDPTVNWWDPHRWMQVTNIGKDGEVLMLCAHGYLLAYSLTERRFRSMEVLTFPAIAVAPSFISLADVLTDQLGTGSLKVRYL